MDLTYTELIEIATKGLHTHGNNQTGTDICKYCGHDLRHPIHFGVEEFKKKTEHFKCMMEN